MKIATFNVNSIKARVDTVLTWFKQAQPDVACLQEIKCETNAFPAFELEALGYNCAVLGQKSYNGVALISKMMARAGVTSAHDAQGSPEDLQAYQDARASGELLLRISCLIAAPHLDRMLAAGVRTGLGDEWVRVGALKMVCDGSISERTVCQRSYRAPPFRR